MMLITIHRSQLKTNQKKKTIKKNQGLKDMDFYGYTQEIHM